MDSLAYICFLSIFSTGAVITLCEKSGKYGSYILFALAIFSIAGNLVGFSMVDTSKDTWILFAFMVNVGVLFTAVLLYSKYKKIIRICKNKGIVLSKDDVDLL